MDYGLLTGLIAGIVVLLILILWVRIQAFLALLIASLMTAVFAGLPLNEVILSVQTGMGKTLGFVATIVGLGAIFGAILQASGGTISIANVLIKKLGNKNMPGAMMLTGFLVAIPVFFDVAFIILIPILYSLQRKTGKSLLLFAIPLLGGLAVAHSFIPPTPGPIAVAEILSADLGKVISLGILAGLPAAITGGLIYGIFISKRIKVDAPGMEEKFQDNVNLPSFTSVFFIIALPILLIIANTLIKEFKESINLSDSLLNLMEFIGHPFCALIIANIFCWYFLGIKKGLSKDQLLKISTDSLAPAGMIILITGAGGVFKEVLTKTGTGEMLATSFLSMGISPLFFAFITSTLIRILQGSATVAMTTSAGLTASFISGLLLSEWDLAELVIAIACGATMASHVNDSGFWLVGKYLGLNEKQTFRTWTISSTLIGITGFSTILILHFFK